MHMGESNPQLIDVQLIPVEVVVKFEADRLPAADRTKYIREEITNYKFDPKTLVYMVRVKGSFVPPRLPPFYKGVPVPRESTLIVVYNAKTGDKISLSF